MAGRRPTFAEVDEIVELEPAVPVDCQFPVPEQTEHDHGEGSTSYPSLRKRKRTQAFVVSHLPSRITKQSSGSSSSESFTYNFQRKRSLARAQTFADALCSSTSSSFIAHRTSSCSNTLPLPLKAKTTRKTAFVREPLFWLLDPDLSIPEDTFFSISEDDVDTDLKEGTQADSSDAHLLKGPVRRSSSKRPSLAEAQERQKKVSLHEKLKSVPVPIAERKALWETYADFDPSLVAGAAWRGWEKRKAQLTDFWKQLDIWTSHFKEIEGRFGSATASYFRFTRWLVFLNLTTFLTTILVIVIPFISSAEPTQFGVGWTPQANITDEPDFVAQAIQCSSTYRQSLRNFTAKEKLEDEVLDFFIGTGWMEKTVMFYGYYHNRTFTTDGTDYNYNMGLAYLLSISITFLLSFVLILVNSSHSIKETVMDDQEQSSVHFTNSVLCGWDYCIFDEKTAKSKKSILFQEFKADLEEQSKRLQRQNRTNGQILALFVLRVAINFVVLSIMAGTIFLIYFTTDQLLELKADNEVVQLIIQFLPSLTITFLNFLIPEIFSVLVAFEDYWPAFALKITLMRCVFVRMSSVGVLTITLYYKVLRNDTPYHCPEEGKINVTTCCGNARWQNAQSATVECWETYVGQQIYKLVIVDFLAVLLITFCVEFPRKLLFDHFRDKSTLVNEFGKQDFDIPKHVLEIVYYQSLSWLGTFFAPLLPAMTLIKLVLTFYLKKLSLMKNHAPPQQVYRVSKSNSFFNIILLIFFVLVAVIVGYMVGNINPSKSCGPFRRYSMEDYLTWTALTDVVGGWPEWASKIFFFFGTTAFFVPCFIVLCLLMYYYWAVGQGYRRMEEILREQLKLEGKDKQFLLARVNDIIKQGNLQGVTSTLPQTHLPQ